MAVTVKTSSYADGTPSAMSSVLFPAATTYTTPAATELQIARCTASLFARPQLPSSEPLPRRLMLATAMSLLGSESVRVEVTKSMPQITFDQLQLPCFVQTRTAHRRAPGATPATPK